MRTQLEVINWKYLVTNKTATSTFKHTVIVGVKQVFTYMLWLNTCGSKV